MPGVSAESVTQPAIRLENLCKVFGANPEAGVRLMNEGMSYADLAKRGHIAALRNINLHVDPGEIYVVMGLSGSGKSTLVRCINRLIDPTSGSVWIGDKDITTLSDRELRSIRTKEIAMVFQRFALLPHLSVLDNIAFGLRVVGIPKKERRERACAALELVGLSGWGDRKPRQLSGGMQQRVGLARALAIETPILLMDEPFGALDPLLREDLQQELLDLQAKLKKTIVFITHDLAEALTLGNRIAIVRSGEIVQEATPSTIVTSPVDSYVEAFVKEVNVLKILRIKDAYDENFSRQDLEKARQAGYPVRGDELISTYMDRIAAGGQLIGLNGQGIPEGVVTSQSLVAAIVKARSAAGFKTNVR